MRTLVRNSSLLCAVLFTLLGLVFAVQVDYKNITDNVIPLGCVAIALAAAVAELMHRGGPVDWTVTGGLGLSLFGCYLVLIRTVGFLAATPLFVMAVFVVTRQDKKRALIAGAAFGLVLTISVYCLFVVGMGNLLPMGMFE